MRRARGKQPRRPHREQTHEARWHNKVESSPRLHPWARHTTADMACREARRIKSHQWQYHTAGKYFLATVLPYCIHAEFKAMRATRFSHVDHRFHYTGFSCNAQALAIRAVFRRP